MKKLLKNFSLVLAFATMSTSAIAQFDALDFIKQDATMIVVESSQLKGEINSLIQKIKNNSPSLLSDMNEFDASYSALESRVAVINERIANLSSSLIGSEELAASSMILTQQLGLMAGDKASFISGSKSSGVTLKGQMGLIKNLAQDIRAEVIAMKNSSN